MNLFQIPDQFIEDVRRLAVMTEDRSSVVSEVEELYASLFERISDAVQDEELNKWLDGEFEDLDPVVCRAVGNLKSAMYLDVWVKGCKIENKRNQERREA